MAAQWGPDMRGRIPLSLTPSDRVPCILSLPLVPLPLPPPPPGGSRSDTPAFLVRDTDACEEKSRKAPIQ
ncbi:hypothetical protein MYCTH_2303434 [Thermothelomyces thermophilus ATCC 42464]|uniref:Uncharacterized protein n=1 Tax=Thermothelomyces thermophilus (strain ATCC 42464 / BCRC 31852 / DSM 1799) TaxID=573729 RepID=G2QCP3_THET4|nr:uncharacterized protein MYCTH_2303434 [Thermothelomyces thermophilus ATCC 42464]AEO57366.1 hypothetical protein MYCTH_2303434 [Thermothelomyces thermophilus ATCC 42464]